jgi:hypothetical protein
MMSNIVREAMTSRRAIPTSGRGRAYRTLLAIGGLVAVIGIADAGRALFWLILNGSTTGSGALAMEYVKPGLRLVAWSLVALAGYTGWRRNVIPATWILVSIPIVAWALLLALRNS